MAENYEEIYELEAIIYEYSMRVLGLNFPRDGIIYPQVKDRFFKLLSMSNGWSIVIH